MMPRYNSSSSVHPVSTFPPNSTPMAHRIMENLTYCPSSLAAYVAVHMDSIRKILNHLLLVSILLDIFLLFASFSVAFLSSTNSLGFNPILVSLLLLTQASIVWMIVNNNSSANLFASWLAPTEFKVGMAMGMTMGAVVLSFLISHAFRDTSTFCNNPFVVNYVQQKNSTGQQQPILPLDPMPFVLLCRSRKGSMLAVWFWSSLSFWCNFVCCMLLWVGHSELAQSSQYATLNTDDPEHNQFSQPNQRPGTSFVGDYATVPEIRTDSNVPANTGNNTNNGFLRSGYTQGGYSDGPQLTAV